MDEATFNQLANKDIADLTEEEAKDLYAYYQFLAQKYTNFEQAVKKSSNSTYGAFGNVYFHWFNLTIAEAITAQGRKSILYAEDVINKYFTQFYHQDTKLHDKLGLRVNRQLKNPAVIYIDTDSCYIQFGEMYAATEFVNAEAKPDITQFIKLVFQHRLADYIDKALDRFAQMTNSDNYMQLELESIAYNGIWMSKKKYIQNISWDDKKPLDDTYDHLSYVKSVGFDVVMSSTPKFARDKLTEANKILFDAHDQPTEQDLEKLIKFLAKTKKEFKLADVEDISINTKTNNIAKYILDDQENFEIAPKTPINVKGAGFYNYLLNNHPEYKRIYNLISDGEKLKVYYSKHPMCGVFAFLPGAYPYQFAPEIDHEEQFKLAILSPINHVLEAIGMKKLNLSLVYTSSLF